MTTIDEATEPPATEAVEPSGAAGPGFRVPRQARSQETLERFLQATRELLDERPFEEITVADIVERAGRTVGSFYGRFEDKYGVLYQLVERLDERIRHLVRAFCDPVRWDGTPVGEFVLESIRLNVGAYQRAGALYRASLTACTHDERFRSARRRTLRYCADAQKSFLQSRADELGCAYVDRASDRMFELVSATLDQELLFGGFTETRPDSSRELIEDLAQACCALLVVPLPESLATR